MHAAVPFWSLVVALEAGPPNGALAHRSRRVRGRRNQRRMPLPPPYRSRRRRGRRDLVLQSRNRLESGHVAGNIYDSDAVPDAFRNISGRLLLVPYPAALITSRV